MDKLNMVDLYGQYLAIRSEIDTAITDVLTSTSFIQGPQVNEFAIALSRYLDCGAVIPCGNGTDALQIAMMSLDLKPGDEVILPVHTYVATAEVIALLGLTPVFVDVEQNFFNIDISKLRELITTKTKAIVPVHLYGQCAAMEEILQIAKQYNLYVIEDAAQALGAEYIFSKGTKRKAGTMGIIGTTSFFPSKNLGCFGDGGAIFTSDLELAQKIRMIANHGQRVKYRHDVIGVNSRLDTLQAAVLLVKLKYLDKYTEKRNNAARYYDENLQEIQQVKIPLRSKSSTHVFHQYTIQAERRDELKSFLEQEGIPSMIYYPIPLHLQPAYKKTNNGIGEFPVAEKLASTVLSLPIHTEMTNSQLEFICTTINRFYHE